MLWIALKSWYLWYSEQPKGIFKTNETVVNCSQKLISLIFGTTTPLTYAPTASCELLSKVDIFDIRNNKKSTNNSHLTVVNCSQKLISLIFGTTAGSSFIAATWLWIALKSWYLWYSEQHEVLLFHDARRCELLSKVDIFDIRNNLSTDTSICRPVVNCSQKLISLIFGTTSSETCVPLFSCELLSKVDIFDIRNN